MESLVEGISSLPNSHTPFTAIKGNTSSASRTSRPPHPTSMRQSRCKELSFDPIAVDLGSKATDTPTGSVTASKCSNKSSSDRIKRDDVSGSRRHYTESTKGKEFQGIEDALGQPSEECSLDRVLIFETKSSMKDSLHENKHTTSGGNVERRDFMLHAVARGDADLLNGQLTSQSGISYCPSPQNSFYTATQYIEPKQSFTTTEVISECAMEVVMLATRAISVRAEKQASTEVAQVAILMMKVALLVLAVQYINHIRQMTQSGMQFKLLDLLMEHWASTISDF